MTRKECQALALKHCQMVSVLIGPISNQQCIIKEIKLDEHNIDQIIEVVERMKHIKLKRSEVVAAISNYYLTMIMAANSYIISFRFANTSENGKNILRVFATIRVDLKPSSKRPRAHLSMKDVRAAESDLF